MQTSTLEQLRARIRHIEKRNEPLPAPPGDMAAALPDLAWRLGENEIDRLLPHGLSPTALHEIAPAAYKDSRAALSFALALLSRRLRHQPGPVLWCFSSADRTETGHPCAAGLARLRLDPERFIFVEANNRRDSAFVLEESLRAGSLAAVLALTSPFDFTTSRRLSLAAREGGTPALLLTGAKAEGDRLSATRWRVTGNRGAAMNGADRQRRPLPQLYRLAWRVELLRNRHGPSGRAWPLSFSLDNPYAPHSHEQAFRFHIPAAPADRTAAAA